MTFIRAPAEVFGLVKRLRLANQVCFPPTSVHEDLIVYPKNGQTTEQQTADRYQCHSWAKAQTGFDPTETGGGVPVSNTERSRSSYNRSMSGCLTARGYEVT
jgi:hypothetical protein